MIVFFIILSGLFLRLWNFDNLFYFAIDEEKAAYIISQITNFTHFPTVGHPSSIGFRLGPVLYYLIAPFYKIFGAKPLIWGYLSVSTSLISMVLIYKIGQKLGKFTGLFALILYCFSYLNILYDRRGWQLSFHSLIALTILYSLIQLKKAKEQYIYVLTFALIAASQFEVATLLFIPSVLIIWKVINIKVSRIKLWTCIFIFLMSHSSLLLFDIRHNFLNTKYLVNFFNPQASERVKHNDPLIGIKGVYLAHNLIPSTFARTLSSFSVPNIAIQYANCPQYLDFKQGKIPFWGKLFSLIILITFFYHTSKNWRLNSEKAAISKIISLYFFLLFVSIAIYTYFINGEMAEYYLLSAFAYFFIIAGHLSEQLFKSKIRYAVIIIFFIFIYDNSNNLIKSFNPYGYKQKIDAVNYSLSIIGNKSFVLDSYQTCWYSGGYRYLYTLAGRQPLRSYMDQYLSEYYNYDKKSKALYQVTILTPEILGENPIGYKDLEKELISTSAWHKRFGATDVYIKRL